jgi:hypothetical protein
VVYTAIFYGIIFRKKRLGGGVNLSRRFIHEEKGKKVKKGRKGKKGKTRGEGGSPSSGLNR